MFLFVAKICPRKSLLLPRKTVVRANLFLTVSVSTLTGKGGCLRVYSYPFGGWKPY